MKPAHKSLAFLSTSALAAGAAHGAVLYTPLNISVAPHGTLSFDLNQDGTPDFQLAFNANGALKPYITNAPPSLTTPFVLSSSVNNGLPLTVSGTPINASYQSAQSVGYFNQNANGNAAGSWTGAGNVEGYVGLELVEGTSTNFGWAHFIYNSTAKPADDNVTGALTLVDAAIETTPGVGIQAGQTAETGAVPVIAVPPSSQNGYPGGTAQLTVAAESFPAPTYQWQAGTVGSGIYTNLPNGAGVTDGAMNTLTLRNLTAAKTADYVVVVSNVSGAVTSSIPATLTVLSSSDTPATLVHRYSFQDAPNSSSFADSVGGSAWYGTLAGNAQLTGSSLVLDGSAGTGAILPAYITSNYTQLTVEFWADIGNQNAVWTRVFFFGQSSGEAEVSGVDYCPYASGNYQNLNMTANSGANDYANSTPGLNSTTGVHVTAIVDPVDGWLGYFNGTNVVSINNAAVFSLTNITDVNNWIGASPFAIDPYLVATIYEFRVYQGVLSPQAIALNDAVGPANYIQLAANPAISASTNAGNIVLSWPASDYNFVVQTRTNLGSGGWTTLTNAPALAGTNWQVTLPSSGPAQFYQLIYQ